MKSSSLGIFFAFTAALSFNQFGYAAEGEAPATPEPGDSAVVEKIEVVPSEPAPVETTIETTTVEEKTVQTPAPEFNPKTIDQRVTATQEVLRVPPRSKKNVTRIDNRPNRPQVKPIAVISGPVSPWGYANRYIAGEVDRPSARDLQGTGGVDSDSPGGAAQLGRNSRGSRGGAGGQGNTSRMRSRKDD
jgi:hypothetical protein